MCPNEARGWGYAMVARWEARNGSVGNQPTTRHTCVVETKNEVPLLLLCWLCSAVCDRSVATAWYVSEVRCLSPTPKSLV